MVGELSGVRGAGGGGVDGRWKIDGLAVVESADPFDRFANGFFLFVGGRGGHDFPEWSGEFAAAFPSFFGGARPGPIDFVSGGIDRVKTCFGESACEPGFIGETEDMRRIRLGLGNLDVFEERADHRAEQRIFFDGPPGDERDPAARLQDTAHFPESFVNVRNEHDAEAASHAIEMAIGEWKLLGVRGLEFDVADTPGRGNLLGHLQHLADQIGRDDSALRTDSDCEGERRLAGTTGEIEDVHAGSESRAIHDKFGGATRLMGELGVPFSPERSGGDPFLADGFARIARSKGVPGHDRTLKGASRFNELYVNWVSVREFLAVNSKVIA